MGFGLVISLTSCHDLVDGTSGAVISENRQEPNFYSINMEHNIDVFVQYDTISSIRVEAGENLIDYIETSVVNNVLYIYEAPNNIVNAKPIRVYLTMDSLVDIDIEGSGDLDVNNMFGSNLNVVSLGSGDANIEYDGLFVNYESRGSGDTYFVGTTNTFNTNLEGSGDLMARHFHAQDVNVKVDGSGDAIVYAANSLTAQISGSGDINYYGNPLTVSTSVTGSGNIYAH